MTELTVSLNRLDNVLNQTAPIIANRLQPGLSRAEIDQRTASFSWALPQDAYDLYQWHNGLSSKPEKMNYPAASGRGIRIKIELIAHLCVT